jgi:hypothetical protein
MTTYGSSKYDYMITFGYQSQIALFINAMFWHCVFLYFLKIHELKIQFGTLLIIWANDQHCLHYKCHCLMINPNKFTKQKLSISYYMNLKYQVVTYGYI